MTRLTEAARNGEKEEVKEFIQFGDDINEIDGVYNCHYHLFLTLYQHCAWQDFQRNI